MIITDHAAQRLAARGISKEDVDFVLARPIGNPSPGDGGNLVFRGLRGGQRLAVVTSSDRARLVTAYWET